ncbi:MAG TPA: alanine racemase [Streptosporangiaceae bacterium]|nr:alanine racemase [Streptosporangiaceae bacterium]
MTVPPDPCIRPAPPAGIREALDKLIGEPADVADTPAPLLDLDAFERNAGFIASFLREHGLAWRPHAKAHKSPQLAKLQLRHGAIGVTCAKLSEAEVMAAHGIGDILVANHLSTPAKWARAAAAQQRARVAVAVDDREHVRMASAAGTAAGTRIPLFIEVDVGMHRTGVRTAAAALGVAGDIAGSAGVFLAGVMGYEGHLLKTWPEADKRAECAQALAGLTGIADDLRSAGHEIAVVSSGGTGSFQETADLPGLTESQAGGGCLMDRFYAEDCHIALEQALTVLTSVVSVHPGGAVVDAGFKTCGNLVGFSLPLVLGRPGVTVLALSAEHGILGVAGRPLRIGEQIRLVPGYSDAMLVLHDNLIGHRDGVITEIVAMPGRGRLT